MNKILLITLIGVSLCMGLTDSEIENIKNGFESRAQQMLVDMYFSPKPEPPFATTTESVYNKLNSALTRLYLGYDISTANTLLQTACDELVNNPDPTTYYYGEAGFHWHCAMFARVYEMFGPSGIKTPGLLTPQTCQDIYNCMWNWAKVNSLVADSASDSGMTWHIWASENHDMQRDASSWAIAKILKDVAPYNEYHYDDGSTASYQYEQWTRFFKVYLAQRAKRGLFVEIASPGYASHTMKNIYNFYDFADDPVLRFRAKGILDMWWTDWALEQIDGVRGGSKARSYQGNPCQLGYYNSGSSGCWFYLNIGNPKIKDIYTMIIATSGYRMPVVTMDIALDRGDSVYEYVSRRPGLSVIPQPAALDDDYYAIDPVNLEIVKYTYVTADYVMGTSLLPFRPESDWANISDQNRWHGVIFKGHPDARIYPQCERIGGGLGNTYNQQWSVQHKGTMIAQKLSSSWQAGNMRVWFASVLDVSEESGWVFAEASTSYAAVKIVSGTYQWQDQNWLRCDEEYTPVILETAGKSDYADFATFKQDVLNNNLNYANGILTYEGLGDSGVFTFYADFSNSPRINDIEIDYEKAFTFSSPYMNEDWASGIVTIEKEQRSLTLDFNVECSDSDLNGDCSVDINDFGIFASDWLWEMGSLIN